MKTKISEKDRNQYLIIESKKEIEDLIWRLRYNKSLLCFYNDLKNEEICMNAKLYIRKLILNNLEIYKELTYWTNFLKNRFLELKKDPEKSYNFSKKAWLHIQNNHHEYDNLVRDKAREDFAKQGWDNYLSNFSK